MSRIAALVCSLQYAVYRTRLPLLVFTKIFCGLFLIYVV